MLDLKRTKAQTSPDRGKWCNRCGTRLRVEVASLRHALPSVADTLPAAPQGRAMWLSSPADRQVWALCAGCCAEGIRCAVCDAPVTSKGVLHEEGREIYCRPCYDTGPRCDTCARPVVERPLSRSDGRQMCGRCIFTAVADPAVAHALYKQVRSSLARLLGMRLGEPCQLKLAGRSQMMRLLDKSAALAHLDAGSRGRCFGLFLREGWHRAIFVEYGLPRIVLLEVLAHEYAHAWYSEHCPPDAPLELQEGFAEWVSYKLLERWGCHKRTARVLRRDDLYGRGLQRVLAWERKGGVDEVFRRVANSGT